MMVRLPSLRNKSEAEPLPTPPQPNTGKSVSPLEPRKIQKSQNPVRDIIAVMASEQRRVFITAFAYFIAMPTGLGLLMASGLYLLGPVMLALTLALWMMCTTLLFGAIAWRSYGPVKVISQWLDAQITMEEQ